MIYPLDDFIYLINTVILGEEPSIEDFILLVGTVVAFIAFILWCCFPVVNVQVESEVRNGQLKYNQRKAETAYHN